MYAFWDQQNPSFKTYMVHWGAIQATQHKFSHKLSENCQLLQVLIISLLDISIYFVRYYCVFALLIVNVNRTKNKTVNVSLDCTRFCLQKTTVYVTYVKVIKIIPKTLSSLVALKYWRNRLWYSNSNFVQWKVGNNAELLSC